MEPIVAETWSELVFADQHSTPALSRAVQRGTLRRLGRGIYTGLVEAEPAEVVDHHLYDIVAHEFPGAGFVDRSARTPRPDGGALYLAHTRRRPLQVAGVVMYPRPGSAADGDVPLPRGLWLSSPARGLLDNLKANHGNSSLRRTMDREALEEWIEDLLGSRGEAYLNQVREHARRIAGELGRKREFTILDGLIGAALTTRESSQLASPRLAARARGEAFDALRIRTFEVLRSELDALAPDVVPDLPIDAARRKLLPFYEAYFSNFIEGTEFTVDEAAAIVLEGRVREDRPADAHDILGTYLVVSDQAEMATAPSNFDRFEDLLRRRHGVILGGRPETGPGEYKTRNNRAGSTEFVDHTLVAGTLRRGFDLASGLTSPFARAVFMMFLVAEVHPFTDGNGRIARIMMNAELVAGGEVRILIPTVFRANYLAALKGATHNRHFAGLISTLTYARRYTARVDFTGRATAEADFERTNAFRDPAEAEAAGIRLVLP